MGICASKDLPVVDDKKDNDISAVDDSEQKGEKLRRSLRLGGHEITSATHAIVFAPNSSEDLAEKLREGLEDVCGRSLLSVPDVAWLRSVKLHAAPSNDGARPRIPILVGRSEALEQEIGCKDMIDKKLETHEWIVCVCKYKTNIHVPEIGATELEDSCLLICGRDNGDASRAIKAFIKHVGTLRPKIKVMWDEKDGRETLERYIGSFHRAFCWTGHGSRQGIDKLESVVHSIGASLHPLVTGERVLAIYGGDPYDSNNHDIAAVMHRLKKKFNISVLAVQCDAYADGYLEESPAFQHVDAVFLYKTQRNSEGGILWGGYHPSDGSLVGASALWFSDRFTKSATKGNSTGRDNPHPLIGGLIAIGGGQIASEEMQTCHRIKMPLYYIRAKVGHEFPRDPGLEKIDPKLADAAEKYGIAHAWVLQNDIKRNEWTIPPHHESQSVLPPQPSFVDIDKCTLQG